MRRIGLLVNPVAGMGGSVGLKGTDRMVAEALSRGAVPRANHRAEATLALVAGNDQMSFVTCSGSMGEDSCRAAGIRDFHVVYQYDGESSAEDTRRAVQQFLAKGVDLILFCGGDGTARDVVGVVGQEVPVLGIPAGVKMYSAVFAIDPNAAAEIISGVGAFVVRDAEVLDVDEEAYRTGILKTRIFGFARVPVLAGMTQVSKQLFEEADEERAKQEIARFIAEVMLPGTLYILGAGTTTEAIARHLGIKKTLLGVDVLKDGVCVAQDVNEKTLLSLVTDGTAARIVISPIGAQGFILGRGNQQISAAVVRQVGIKNIIVVGTPHKLRDTPTLYVDTGDTAQNAAFGSSILVISGYRMGQRKRIWQADPAG